MSSWRVLPDGRPARGHPANEDLFAGTPVRSGHFVTCIPLRLALPLVAREMISTNGCRCDSR
ncbi:hypothetical protein HDF10_002876 [Edaphobacter lichenicola]|uniref:Uncharacterized protein n=1 Tax=Tunturiibacter lichenicola TaxID=2051959 RepID=A0A7W8J953_9BACT|nr:hypothetical protein [Edaphobacter lichenicola]